MDTDQLLQILACPKCHAGLSLVESGHERGFLCEDCQVVYPIRDEIPIMLIEEAIPVDQWRNDPCAS